MILLVLIVMFPSCIETHVINTVHKDGSISRRLIIRNDENEFPPELIPVPFDSTWATDTTWETGGPDKDGDTVTWVLTATREFAGVEEINEAYRNDRGSNRDLRRSAAFSKEFMWFTTKYRFSERVEGVLTIECPVSDFLSDEELSFFYLPDELKTMQRNGSDSLRIRELSDAVDRKSDQWLWTVLFREWIGIFYDRFGGHPELAITKDDMLSKEPEVVELFIRDSSESGNNDAVFILLFGEEQYRLLETEIDSATKLLEDRIDPCLSADDYGMEIRMPGRIVASNGYADTQSDSASCGGILWTVSGDYFLNQPFEMWVESQVNNYWAWAVTFVFVLFVFSGFIIKRRTTLSRSEIIR